MESQEQLKLQLQAWMDKKGVTAKDLAARCHVTTNTIKKWLTTAPIPDDKQALLLCILREEELDRKARQSMRANWQPVSIMLSRQAYERLCLIARVKNTTPQALIEEKLTEFINLEWAALTLASSKPQPQSMDVPYAEEVEEEIRPAAEEPDQFTP